MYLYTPGKTIGTYRVRNTVRMFERHFMQRRLYTNVQCTVAPVSLPPPSFLQEMRTQISEKDWVAKLKGLLKKLHGTEYEKVSR